MMKISPAKCQQCPLMRHGYKDGKVVWNMGCLKDGYCFRYTIKLTEKPAVLLNQFQRR